MQTDRKEKEGLKHTERERIERSKEERKQAKCIYSFCVFVVVVVVVVVKTNGKSNRSFPSFTL